MNLNIPIKTCAGCRRDFAEGDEVVVVTLTMPPGTEIKEDVVAMSASAYHSDCTPSEDELNARAKELWP